MTKKVNINPQKLGIAWSTTTNYRIEIEQGFVKESANNQTPSPASTSAYSFSTTAFVSPSPNLIKSDTQDGIFINNTSSSFPVFPLKSGNRGAIYQSTITSNLYLYSGTTLISTIPTTSTKVTYSQNQIAINLYGLINSSTNYSIEGDARVGEDIFNNPTVKFTGTTKISFTSGSYISMVPSSYQLTPYNISSISKSSSYIGVGFRNDEKAILYSNTGSIVRTFSNPDNLGNTIDYFGHSISIDNDYTLVGASLADNTATNSVGRAYLYSNSTGQLLRTLVGSDGTTAENFGHAVALKGDKFIISRYPPSTPSAGTTYIYSISNPNSVVTHSTGIGFGWSVAISDNYAIVGTNNKAAYVCSLTTSNNYVYSFILTYSGNSLTSVDIDNTYAVVGASGYSNNSGRVYVYNISNGSLRYTIDNPTTTGGSSNLDFFGYNVKIIGSKLFVFAKEEASPASFNDDVGMVYVFDISTGNLLDRIANPYFTSPLGSNDDEYGTIITGQGSDLIIGYQQGLTNRFYKYSI